MATPGWPLGTRPLSAPPDAGGGPCPKPVYWVRRKALRPGVRDAPTLLETRHAGSGERSEYESSGAGMSPCRGRYGLLGATPARSDDSGSAPPRCSGQNGTPARPCTLSLSGRGSQLDILSSRVGYLRTVDVVLPPSSTVRRLIGCRCVALPFRCSNRNGSVGCASGFSRVGS